MNEPIWNTDEQTYDAQGRAQLKASAHFTNISMTQGGDLKGNSAWVELEIEAEQPVEVRVNERGNPVIRITGTFEMQEVAAFFDEKKYLINTVSEPDETF